MQFERNIVANYLGQGWVALMGLIFIPLYIKYLGIEAYALIGLFGMLLVWLSLLDMGMTPVLGREMARFTGGSHTVESIRDLLRSIEFLALGIALTVAGVIVASADWVANSWLNVETLPTRDVAKALVIMGLVTSLRFMEEIYRSSIIGLQRQVLLNAVNCSLATVRGLGAVGILCWVSPTIEAFFYWQALISFITLGVLASITYNTLPNAVRSAHFSVSTIRGVWRFAGGMIGITFLALLLTQVDKILLSRLLSLSEFGYYSLAAVVAAALYTLILPITQALYPRLCKLHANNDTDAFVNAYHNGSQLVSVIAGGAAVVFILFSQEFLLLWTRDVDLARRTAPLLSILMLGNLLNGLMWIPYQAQLAHGWTTLTLRINLFAVLIIVPAILWATPRYGAEGAAWVWVILNAGYLLIGVNFMYRRILTLEKKRWYISDLLMPLGSSLAAALILKQITPVADTLILELLYLGLAGLVTIGAALFAATQTRRQFLDIAKFIWVRWQTLYDR